LAWTSQLREKYKRTGEIIHLFHPPRFETAAFGRPQPLLSFSILILLQTSYFFRFCSTEYFLSVCPQDFATLPLCFYLLSSHPLFSKQKASLSAVSTRHLTAQISVQLCIQAPFDPGYSSFYHDIPALFPLHLLHRLAFGLSLLAGFLAKPYFFVIDLDTARVPPRRSPALALLSAVFAVRAVPCSYFLLFFLPADILQRCSRLAAALASHLPVHSQVRYELACTCPLSVQPPESVCAVPEFRRHDAAVLLAPALTFTMLPSALSQSFTPIG
jgi:hypothetical protein